MSHLFTAGEKPIVNKVWQQSNIISLSQLILDGNIVDLSEPKRQYKLNDSNFFQYMQLKIILKTYVTKGIILNQRLC